MWKRLPLVLVSMVSGLGACPSASERTAPSDAAAPAITEASTTIESPAHDARESEAADTSEADAAPQPTAIEEDASPSPFAEVATRSDLTLVHDVGGKVIVTAGTDFFEVRDDGSLRRLPDLSRGMLKNNMRGFPPDIRYLAGRWPNALYAMVDVHEGGGRTVPLESPFRWDASERTWKYLSGARLPEARSGEVGNLFYRRIAPYRDGALVAAVSVRPGGSDALYRSLMDARLRGIAPLQILDGPGTAPTLPAGVCLDDFVSFPSGEVFVLGRKCGEAKALLFLRAGSDAELPPPPFEAGENVEPQIAGASPTDVYAWAGDRVARFDGAAWKLLPIPKRPDLHIEHVVPFAGGIAYLLGAGERSWLWRRSPDGSLSPVALPHTDGWVSWSSMVGRADGDVWLAGSRGPGGAAAIYRSKMATHPAVKLPSAAEIDAETADRDAPRAGPCAGTVFTLVKDLPASPRPFPFVDVATKAQPTAGPEWSLLQVLWRGRRYLGFEDRAFGPETPDATKEILRRYRALGGQGTPRRFCDFYPKVEGGADVGSDGNAREQDKDGSR